MSYKDTKREYPSRSTRKAAPPYFQEGSTSQDTEEVYKLIDKERSKSESAERKSPEKSRSKSLDRKSRSRSSSPGRSRGRKRERRSSGSSKRSKSESAERKSPEKSGKSLDRKSRSRSSSSGRSISPSNEIPDVQDQISSMSEGEATEFTVQLQRLERQKNKMLEKLAAHSKRKQGKAAAGTPQATDKDKATYKDKAEKPADKGKGRGKGQAKYNWSIEHRAEDLLKSYGSKEVQEWLYGKEKTIRFSKASVFKKIAQQLNTTFKEHVSQKQCQDKIGGLKLKYQEARNTVLGTGKSEKEKEDAVRKCEHYETLQNIWGDTLMDKPEYVLQGNTGGGGVRRIKREGKKTIKKEEATLSLREDFGKIQQNNQNILTQLAAQGEKREQTTNLIASVLQQFLQKQEKQNAHPVSPHASHSQGYPYPGYNNQRNSNTTAHPVPLHTSHSQGYPGYNNQRNSNTTAHPVPLHASHSQGYPRPNSNATNQSYGQGYPNNTNPARFNNEIHDFGLNEDDQEQLLATLNDRPTDPSTSNYNNNNDYPN